MSISSCSRSGKWTTPEPVDEARPTTTSAPPASSVGSRRAPAPDEEGDAAAAAKTSQTRLHSVAPQRRDGDRARVAVATAARRRRARPAGRRTARSPWGPIRTPARGRRRRRGPPSRATSISGHSARAAGSRSLTISSSGRSRRGRARPRAAWPRARPRRAAGPGDRPRGRRRRSTARRASGQHEHAVGRRRRAAACRRSPAPVGQVAPRAHLGGDVGAQLGGDLAQQRVVVDPRRARGEPQGRARVGAAAGHPGRDRDPLLDPQPHRRAVPPVRARKRRRASAARFSPSTPGQMTRSIAEPRPARLELDRGRPARCGWKTVTSSWRPSARAGPT